MSKKKKTKSTDEARARREAALAAARKEQAVQARKRAMLTWGALGLVLVLMAGAITWAILDDRKDRPDLAGVQAYEHKALEHTTGPVEYTESPPTGGAHNPAWLNCGVYDEPVRNEVAVHSLEHGAVWITYPTDLPEADVKKLEDATPKTFAILSPFEGLDKVTVSAWGKQLTLDGADDPRLAGFIKEYRQGPQTPEPGAACTGGVDA